MTTKIKVKTDDLSDLLAYVDVLAIYITDDHWAEMEEDYSKKSLKRARKIVNKFELKVAEARDGN